MYSPKQECFEDVLDKMSNMFGQALDRDSLINIINSCECDLSLSIETALETANNATKSQCEEQPSTSPKMVDIQKDNQKSYATIMSNSKGAIPKQIKNTKQQVNRNIWPESVKKIIEYHNKGYCTLVLMRGAPGSGKTYLAKQIIEMLLGHKDYNYQKHICSTDDYFYRRGRYFYVREQVGEAHEWNKERIYKLMLDKVSPIIVDNTNVKLWEMEPYIKDAAREGYIVEVVEPNTPWAKKAYYLAQRNSHKVQMHTIKRMLENYEPAPNVEYLFNLFRIQYSRIPPTMRLHPEFQHVVESVQETPFDKHSYQESDKNSSIENITGVVSNVSIRNDKTNDSTSYYQEIEKKLDELARIEKEWECGESWNDSIGENNYKSINKSNEQIQPILPIKTLTDWSQYTLITNPDSKFSKQKVTQDTPIKISVETCIEKDDMAIASKYKTLSTIPRDINFNFVPKPEKIPEMRMLDKSSIADEKTILSETTPDSVNKHFEALCKMFKNIPRSDLKDIYEKCFGDINWAVEIILEGVNNSNADNYVMDSKDEDTQEEQTKEEINIVEKTIDKNDPDIAEPPCYPSTSVRLKKVKNSENSDAHLQLKQEIEKNFVIGDQHYSQQCLKIKKSRHGDVSKSNVIHVDDNLDEHTSSRCCSESSDNAASVDSTGNDIDDKTICFNLGVEFIRQLDIFYGRESSYPPNVVPLVSMPISILDQINALWMESLTHQNDSQMEYSKILMKQDEEFARQLIEKEEQMAAEGQEPAVPDFKEIMDLDLAVHLSQKDSKDWQKLEPSNMAAKMSREKLYNLFPDVEQDVLRELLMAHNNNFQNTVEVLLMSTGKSHILEEEKGINKFVVKKELERQERLLKEEQNKELSYQEWPVLPNMAEMKDVHHLQSKAQDSLEKRNLCFQKAQEYFRRGMTQVASYYSDMAAFHKSKFEKAKAEANEVLVQVSLRDHQATTIDLHYMIVSEALRVTDMYLDKHIKQQQEEDKLGNVTLYLITGRGTHSAGGPRIRPAVLEKLAARGLKGCLVNPGLVSVKVNRNSKLSNLEQT